MLILYICSIIFIFSFIVFLIFLWRNIYVSLLSLVNQLKSLQISGEQNIQTLIFSINRFEFALASKQDAIIDILNSGKLTGPPGDKGDKGDPGYTPKKNLDYFDGIDGITKVIHIHQPPNESGVIRSKRYEVLVDSKPTGHFVSESDPDYIEARDTQRLSLKDHETGEILFK